MSCQLAKHYDLPFNDSSVIACAPFDFIHYDIWESIFCATIGGLKYFVIFVDDYSYYTWFYLMKHRYELFHVYTNLSCMI